MSRNNRTDKNQVLNFRGKKLSDSKLKELKKKFLEMSEMKRPLIGSEKHDFMEIMRALKTRGEIE